MFATLQNIKGNKKEKKSILALQRTKNKSKYKSIDGIIGVSHTQFNQTFDLGTFEIEIDGFEVGGVSIDTNICTFVYCFCCCVSAFYTKSSQLFDQ